ncbi:MAG TPA: peptidylprolyl isomerase [Gammaproteobacteria bacterium]|nr:peptidylprolyl isomerase [Gammaproteobacteria bacterium]
MLKITPIAATLLLALTTGTSFAEKAAENQLLATVNGVKVTADDLNMYMNTQPAEARPRSMNAAVEAVINREILRQEAIKQKLDKDDDFKKQLEAQKANILVNTLLAAQVEKADVSDAALKKEYDEQLANTDLNEYKARHILVKEEAEAKEIISQLKKDADFQKLAKEKSTGPSGKDGGDLGWFAAATMVPEFGTALKTLKKGKFTEAPVKTQFGWHVILLEDQRKRDVPDFEKSKSRLKQVVASKAVQEYVAKLAKKGKVELNQPEKK